MILHNLLLSSEEPKPEYLFQSQKQDLIFLFLAMEMRHLNDYCVLCDRAASAQVVEWDKRQRAPETEADDFVARLRFSHWSEIQETVVAGMILMLLSTFVEKQLKWFCYLGDEVAGQDVRERPKQSKMDALIQFLRTKVGLQFREPPAWLEFKKDVRPLRNQFAHGDWPSFREQLDSYDLSQAFKAASELFREIEDANSKNPALEMFT